MPVQIALEEKRSLRELGLACERREAPLSGPSALTPVAMGPICSDGVCLRLAADAKKRSGAGPQTETIEAFRARLAARHSPARRPTGRILGQGVSFAGGRGRRPPMSAPPVPATALPRPVWERQRFLPMPSCARHRAWPNGLCDDCAPRPVLLVPQVRASSNMLLLL